jgi:hypothetical protein
MAFLNQHVWAQDEAKELVAAAAQGSNGQLRLNQLEDQGCIFVLRFILLAFRGRRPEDRFWTLLKQFLFDAQMQGEPEVPIAKFLLSRATCLGPTQARALLDFLSQAYAQTADRLFWSTLSDAIQIYPILPGI